MQKRPKDVSPVDWTYNRLGRPINPNFDNAVDELMKKLHAKKGTMPKDQVMVIMSLGTISLEDLDKK
jgi:hypothetical protein